MASTLSVTIPVYNHGQYLKESLPFILSQTRRPDEVILLDDRSTDDTFEVIKRFQKCDPLIRVLRNDRNRGIYYSLGRLLQTVSGDYFDDTAADDPLCDLEFFEKSMDLLEEYPQAGLCCADYTFLYPDGNQAKTTLGLSYRPRYVSPEELVTHLEGVWNFSIPTSSAIWKRSAYIDAGGIVSELRWHADWFVAWVIAFRHGICYLPEQVQIVRRDDRSISQSGMNDLSAYRTVLENLLRLLDEPAYGDVRSYFHVPAVLSRFGFKILDLTLRSEEYRHYLTPSLLECALRAEDFEIPRRYRAENLVELCQDLLTQAAVYHKDRGDTLLVRAIEHAVKEYSKALEARPDLAQALLGMGRVFEATGKLFKMEGKPEEAERCLREAGTLRRAPALSLGECRDGYLDRCDGRGAGGAWTPPGELPDGDKAVPH